MFLILTLFFPHLNQRATGVLKSPSLASLTSLRSGVGSKPGTCHSKRKQSLLSAAASQARLGWGHSGMVMSIL